MKVHFALIACLISVAFPVQDAIACECLCLKFDRSVATSQTVKNLNQCESACHTAEQVWGQDLTPHLRNCGGAESAKSPLPWNVQYCQREPSFIEKMRLRLMPNSKVAEHLDLPGQNSVELCVPLPADKKVSEVFCEAWDAYGSGFCVNFKYGENTRCDIQYAWPTAGHTVSYLKSDGTGQVCVKFYNESHNRERSFRIRTRLENRDSVDSR